MKRYTTKGIILGRTDYGEADRILTFLTDDHGKIKAIAKGVRKAKAKLAGSVELFSLSDLTLISGRREIDTLMSARLIEHYGQIVKDSAKTQSAYSYLALIDKNSEPRTGPEYFNLLRQSLAALNQPAAGAELVDVWFGLQLLKLSGHSPNLQTGQDGQKLPVAQGYDFNLENMAFKPQASAKAPFKAEHIKLFRLAIAAASPGGLRRIEGIEALAQSALPLVQSMLKAHLRL